MHALTCTLTMFIFYRRVQQIALVYKEPLSYLPNEGIKIKMKFRAKSYNMQEK